MNEQRYTIDEIVDVEFKKKTFGGFDTEEVDDFLNGVIDDYEFFINKINELKRINEELRSENFRVKMNVLKTATNTLDLDGGDEELAAANELVEQKRNNELKPKVLEAPQKDEINVQDALKTLMLEIEELKKNRK